jgi:hypothetical protein
MRNWLKKEEWWFYLVILAVCFILAGAIHTFMREPSGGAKGPQVDDEWTEAVRKVLGDRIDETMMEKLRKGQLDESDMERIKKAYGSEVSEEDRRKVKETLERLKKEGRLPEQP